MNSQNPHPFSKLRSAPNPPLFFLMLIIGLVYMVVGALTGFADPTRDMAQAPPIVLTKPYSGQLERALFAGGCFWGTEYSFQQLPGVKKTLVGYTGGKTVNPTYETVCGHGTAHAETVYIEFDPKKLSYRQLVDYFWTIHDPTTVDRQGPDFGTQYRSEIFYTTPEQKTIAEQAKAQAQKNYKQPIATKIEAATTFYPAEEYHQNYDVKHGMRSCAIPKASK